MTHQRDAVTAWSRTEKGNLPVSLLEDLAVFLRSSSGSFGDMAEILFQGIETSAPVQVWLYTIVWPNFQTQLVVRRERPVLPLQQIFSLRGESVRYLHYAFPGHGIGRFVQVVEAVFFLKLNGHNVQL